MSCDSCHTQKVSGVTSGWMAVACDGLSSCRRRVGSKLSFRNPHKLALMVITSFPVIYIAFLIRIIEGFLHNDARIAVYFYILLNSRYNNIIIYVIFFMQCWFKSSGLLLSGNLLPKLDHHFLRVVDAKPISKINAYLLSNRSLLINRGNWPDLQNCLSRKWNWKCRLQNICHFVSTSVSVLSNASNACEKLILYMVQVIGLSGC